MRRRHLLHGAPALLLAQGQARAQHPAGIPSPPDDFPTRPIELTVAFPAGGGMDVTARIVARHAERLTGYPFVVNNRTGGAGIVAHAYLARQARPDGYNVGIFSSGLFADSMLRAQNLWSHTDLEIVSFINYDPTVWLVSTQGRLAGMDIRAILSRAREVPEAIRVSMLPQSSSEFIAEQVEQKAGVRLLKVPFQGGIPGMTAMLGGHVDIATVFFSEFRSQLEAGAVQPVALATSHRVSNLPEVPTFNEVFATEDIDWVAWRFAVVPKDTPRERREFIGSVIRAVVEDPEVRREFARAGVLTDEALSTQSAVQAAAERVVAIQRRFLIGSSRLAR